jgi:glycosyl hydrolase family 97
MMLRHLLRSVCAVWFVLTASAAFAREDTPSHPAATSPDRQIRIELFLEERDGARAAPAYSISFRGRLVVLPSRLGVDHAGGQGLGHDSTIEGVQTRTINETYTQHPGKRSRVLDHCEEVVVMARQHRAEWWLGAMGGREPREVEIPLGFLGPGRFRADVYGDDPNAATRLARRTEDVAAANSLRAPLAPAGGLLIRLSPVNDALKAKGQ